MANSVIQIKTSLLTARPPSLNVGELAYSYASNTAFIGLPDTYVIPIGGKFYIDQQQYIYNQANAAFITANAVSYYANLPSHVANSASTYANIAFDLANAASIHANSGFIHANASFNAANSITTGIGAAYNQANAAFDTANSAAIAANTPSSVANSAYNQANASFEIANSAAIAANTPSGVANAAYNQANAAFNRANTSALSVSLIDDANVFSNNVTQVTGLRFDSNSGFDITDLGSGNVRIGMNSTFKTWKIAGQQDLIANGLDTIAFVGSNGVTITSNTLSVPKSITFDTKSLFDVSNAAFIHANSAFSAANNVGPQIQPAFNTSNAAFELANSAAIAANTPSHVSNSASAYANAAFIQANNAFDTNLTQNNSIIAAFNTGNASFVIANSAAIAANTPSHVANSAAIAANTSSHVANSAAIAANTPSHVANSAAIAANTPSHVANSASVYANGAFARANNSINANTGGTITGNLVVVGNVVATVISTAGQSGNITGADNIYANTFYANNVDLFGFANAAFAVANSAAIAANTPSSVANGAYVQANAAFIIANSAAIAANTPSYAANTAWNTANIVFTFANAVFDIANSAAIAANTPSHVANSASSYANASFIHANSAYATANVKTQTFVQDTAPASANVDDIWIDSSTGIQYFYINSNTANQWVEFSAYSSPLNGTANIQFADQTIFTVDSTRDLVITNPSSANIKLISGNTVFTGNIIADASGKYATFNDVRAVYFRVNTQTIIANSAAVNIIGSTGYYTQAPTSNGYMIQITGPDDSTSRVVNDSAGTGNYSAFIGRHARGTHQNPTAAQANDLLARFSGNGYGATGYGINAGGASMDVYATENYTDTSRGSKLIFSTTANGTNARTVSATIDANTATFSGTIIPQKGFVYQTRTANVGANSVAVTIDFANDAFVRCTINAAMTVHFTNFTAGKIVDLWVTNLAGGGRTVTHGVSATNSTNNGVDKSVPATSTTKFQYYSFDGNLGNTYVAIVQG